MRSPWRPALAALALLAGLALSRPAAAQVVPVLPNAYQFSFLACDFVSGCPNPTEFARFTYFGSSPLTAPAIGANNYYGSFRSAPLEILPLAYGLGFWEHAYITSYRNIYGQTGSFIAFDDLQEANGQDYGDVVGIGAYVGGPTTDPLVWAPGLYTGLIAYECPDIACLSTPGAVESVRLLVTLLENPLVPVGDPNQVVRGKADLVPIGTPGALAPSFDVPEPASALVLGLALAGLALRYPRSGMAKGSMASRVRAARSTRSSR